MIDQQVTDGDVRHMGFATEVIELLEQQHGLDTLECLAVLDLAKTIFELCEKYDLAAAR